MVNIKDHINKHNGKILNPQEVPKECKCKGRCKCKCNCRNPDENPCPMNGNCLVKSVIYKGEASFKDKNDPKGKKLIIKNYYGSTSTTFKQRWYKHAANLRNEHDKEHTSFSKYVWDLRRKGIDPSIKWSVEAKAHTFSSGSRQCDLCLSEKTKILFSDPKMTLNKRSEILFACRHKPDYMLSNCKFSDPNPQIPP